MRRRRLIAAAVVTGSLAFVSFVAQGEGAAPPRAGAASGGGYAGGSGGGGSAAAGAPAHRVAGEGSEELRKNAALVAEGHKLFLSSCASCHGLDAQGVYGRAPDLHEVGELAADFYLETGRMPLSYPQQQPLETKPAFPQQWIDALIAYVGSFGGPPIPTVRIKDGNASLGQQLFALDCAGCHQIQARGGIVTGAVVPRLSNATPTQVAEAIRIGPYVMPRWSSAEISESDVDSIARYVKTTQHPANAGGWEIYRLGPIPEGMVTWFLAIVTLLIVIRVIGERTTP